MAPTIYTFLEVKSIFVKGWLWLRFEHVDESCQLQTVSKVVEIVGIDVPILYLVSTED